MNINSNLRLILIPLQLFDKSKIVWGCFQTLTAFWILTMGEKMQIFPLRLQNSPPFCYVVLYSSDKKFPPNVKISWELGSQVPYFFQSWPSPLIIINLRHQTLFVLFFKSWLYPPLWYWSKQLGLADYHQCMY